MRRPTLKEMYISPKKANQLYKLKAGEIEEAIESMDAVCISLEEAMTIEDSMAGEDPDLQELIEHCEKTKRMLEGYLSAVKEMVYMSEA